MVNRRSVCEGGGGLFTIEIMGFEFTADNGEDTIDPAPEDLIFDS